MQLCDANAFVSEILPEGLVIESEGGVKDSLVCILCHVDFDPDVELEMCQHWIPGWISATVPQGEELQEGWQADFEESENIKIVEYSEQRESCFDETVALSLDHEIARCETRKANFSLMTQLLKDCGIICRNVCSDGNCGVETLLRLQRPANFGEGTEALRPEFAEVRAELQASWDSVVEKPGWRLAFHHLCKPDESDEVPQDQPDQQPAVDKEPESVIATPPRKEKPDDCPFTPDPVEKRKASAPAADGIVVIPGVDATEDPAKKKKRTGKSANIEVRVNPEQYMAQCVSDQGVTYRGWLTMHKKHLVIVLLVLMSVG